MLKKKASCKRVERTKNTTVDEIEELNNNNKTEDKIVIKKEKSLMCVLLESVDIPDNESCDSDYEDNIPLSDYIKIMENTPEISPIRCRTRTQLKEKPWVPVVRRRKVFNLEDYENNPDKGDGIFEIDSTVELGTQSKKCHRLNLTQDQYQSFNKILPICSTSKIPNVELSENLIEMPSPIEISHCEKAVSVNTITPLG